MCPRQSTRSTRQRSVRYRALGQMIVGLQRATSGLGARVILLGGLWPNSLRALRRMPPSAPITSDSSTFNTRTSMIFRTQMADAILVHSASISRALTTNKSRTWNVRQVRMSFIAAISILIATTNTDGSHLSSRSTHVISLLLDPWLPTGWVTCVATDAHVAATLVRCA